MRDSQRQKAYAAERAALAHVTADHIGPTVEDYQFDAETIGSTTIRRLTDEAWRRYRKAAVAALRAEAAPLLRSEWWQTFTSYDRAGARRSHSTAIRIAPKNAYQASRGGLYTNGPAISLLHSMTQRRTLYHELAHVAVYGAQGTAASRAAYEAAGHRIHAEPGHGPHWRGIYVAVLAAAGYADDAAALADGWRAARLTFTPCPIAPDWWQRSAPAPRRLVAADPITTAEPLTLF